MAMTILDNDEAVAANPQSVWMQTDIDAIIAGFNGTYVVSGCAVTPQTLLTLDVAAGTVAVGGVVASVGAGTVVLDTANATNPRVDLVRSDNTGTLGKTTGTAAANPKAPALPANNVLLAMVYVPALLTTVVSGDITDKRVIVPHQGTAGTLAKFSGATTLGNSIFSESGTVATLAGTLVQSQPLGADIVVNGTFASGGTGWTTTGWTVNGTTDIQHDTGNTTALVPSTPLTVTVGKLYRIQFTVSSRTAGSVTASIGGNTDYGRTTNATFNGYIIAATTANLAFTPSTDFDGHLDNISVRESDSTHASWKIGADSPITFKDHGVDGGGAIVLSNLSGNNVVTLSAGTDVGTNNLQLNGPPGTPTPSAFIFLADSKTGSGGALTVVAGSPIANGGDGAGGDIRMKGGFGITNGNGGAAILEGGVAGNTTGSGGNVTLIGGNATVTSASGGVISMTGGEAAGTGGVGGPINLKGGDTLVGGGSVSGHVSLFPGRAFNAGGTHGSVHVTLHSETPANGAFILGTGTVVGAPTTTWWTATRAAGGHWTPGATNTFDLGASGTTVRTAYVGTSVLVGGNTLLGSIAGKVNAAHLAIASQAIGDLLQADATTTFARLAAVAAGSYLRSGGAGAASLWSTLILPNAATTGDLLAATSTNTVGVIAAGAVGTVLSGAGAGTVPTWAILANTVLAIPGANLTASGPQTSAFQAGGTITAGDLVILDSSSQWVQTDANAAATYAGLIAISLESKTVGQAMLVALPGSIVRNTAWAWTPGNTLYVSETAATITATQPVTTDAAILVVGYAVDADDLYLLPGGSYITHT